MDIKDAKKGDILEIKILDEETHKILYHLITLCTSSDKDSLEFSDLKSFIEQEDDEPIWLVECKSLTEGLTHLYKTKKLGTKETLPEYFL